jgi:primosomal protein N' (replication factor Y)
VNEVNQGEPCILLGTQMLAKGHHFPHVTLAALMDVDGGLFSADFRAIERMGQLIIQVAGRAGREHKPGTVILQSHLCDHPLIQQLTGDGYPAFAETLLAQRQLAGLPPWSHLALLRAEADTPALAEQLLARARAEAERLCPPSPALRYLGPLPSPMERRNNRYRYQLALFADQRPLLHGLLTPLTLWLEADRDARKVRWSVDVDPQDMI